MSSQALRNRSVGIPLLGRNTTSENLWSSLEKNVLLCCLIYLGRTGNAICPVTAILSYLALWRDVSGPLFVLQNGRMLTHQIFSDTLDGLLKELYFKKENFNTHSFCIGAATSAKAANISDTHIQMLGRWKSNAFKLYIHTPPQEMANLSRVLAVGAK